MSDDCEHPENALIPLFDNDGVQIGVHCAKCSWTGKRDDLA